MNVGEFKRFNWLPMQPVWKEMEIRRARRAEMIKQDAANMDAMNESMATALQNRISMSANIARASRWEMRPRSSIAGSLPRKD